MNKDDFLPVKMSALWFTYVSIGLYALLPDWGIYLSLSQITGVAAVVTVLMNFWAWYREEPLMDERKQRVVSDAMAWAFVALSLALVALGFTEQAVDVHVLRSIAEFGFWTWLLVFSVKNLYQRYGGEA